MHNTFYRSTIFQGSRIDEQRSNLPRNQQGGGANGSAGADGLLPPSIGGAAGYGADGAGGAQAASLPNGGLGGSLTVPDDDCFQIVMRMQRGRLVAFLPPFTKCVLAFVKEIQKFHNESGPGKRGEERPHRAYFLGLFRVFGPKKL